MSTVAEQLRQARESQKLTIQQAAEITKIRTDHLRALEEGRLEVFSAPVYIRGFVRAYASLLKLEVPRLMGELDAELGRTEKFAEPPPLTEHPRGVLDFLMLQLSKVDWRKALFLLAGILVILGLVFAITAWQRHARKDPLKNLPAGIYQSTQHNSGETLPLPQPPRR